MTQTSLTQHQPQAFDEEVALSPTKSASTVKIGNGSPGAQSALPADTGRAYQVQSTSQHDSPRRTAGGIATNSGQSSKDHQGPADELIPASRQAEASPTASAEPAGIANAPSVNVLHTSQDLSKDDINNGSQSDTADSVQNQQKSSGHSRSAEAGALKVPSPPSSPVKQDIPFKSQGNAKSPKAAAPEDIERAASSPATAASSIGRDAMQPQALLPADSHARAAAVADAIKRASQAIEPEQTATQGKVQPMYCLQSCRYVHIQLGCIKVLLHPPTEHILRFALLHAISATSEMESSLYPLYNGKKTAMRVEHLCRGRGEPGQCRCSRAGSSSESACGTAEGSTADPERGEPAAGRDAAPV